MCSFLENEVSVVDSYRCVGVDFMCVHECVNVLEKEWKGGGNDISTDWSLNALLDVFKLLATISPLL